MFLRAHPPIGPGLLGRQGLRALGVFGFSRNTLSVHSVRVSAASPSAPTSTATDTDTVPETERVPVPYRVTVHIPALRQRLTRVLARLVLPLQGG